MARFNEQAVTINALYERAKFYRAQTKDVLWAESARYLWGDQDIRRTVTEEGHNDFVENIVWKDYQTVLAMLARDVPRISYLGLTSEMQAVQDELSKQTNHILQTNEFIQRLEEMLSYGIPFGRGYFKTTWDRTMRAGLGDVRIEVPDTRDIFFMPGISRLRKSLLVFERMKLDKLTAIHLYPDHIDAINRLFKREEHDGESATTLDQSRDVGYGLNEDGSTSTWFFQYGLKGKDEKAHIEIVQGWFIDTTVLQQVPELFDEVKNSAWFTRLSGAEQQDVANKRLYPRGRLIVFSGPHKFEDKSNPFPSFPYCEYNNLVVPYMKQGDELGMGEFDNLFEIQDMLNVRNNQLMDAMDRTPYGGFGLADRRSHIDIEEITSEARMIYSCNDVNGFKWNPIAPIPAEAFRTPDDLRQAYQHVSNRQNILQGEVPGDVRSGAAISELSALANSTMIPRTHALEGTVRSLARYIIYMVGAFYEPGVHYSEGIDLRGITPDGFDILVKAGMNLPSSQYELRNIAMSLYQANPEVFDFEALLTILDLPNKEMLIEKARAHKAQQLAAMPAQGMAPVQAMPVQAMQR